MPAVRYLDYTIDGDLTLSNLSYSLNATAAGAVVPEPSSFVLAGLATVGLVVLRVKRRGCLARARTH